MTRCEKYKDVLRTLAKSKWREGEHEPILKD